ncbi:MAG: AAA family ATPase [Gammaproteobacteria bacterium]|nr:AAA family ATPase [Gammaproteobacteria bacterium]MBU1775460.1 AAA family ATPase [Gammaproteobacteria bacterium]MBU1969038.1 AAA family ATPase [Gammaproteobacteria bacterium]
MRVIFVAGVHAVGKSTACQFVSNEFGIPYFTASQIIREERASAIAENSKLVADVDGNQKLLLQGVSKRCGVGRLLLDGHFTMRRKTDGEIEAIHIDVFRELRIAGVVLFTDHPEQISKRMLERDGATLPTEMFREHQDAELAHAKFVAESLKRPMVVLRAFDIDSMSKAVQGWVNV